MSDRDRDIRGEIERRLLALSARLPTSSLGRIGRSALAALRGGRAARLARADAAIGLDDLAAFVSAVGQLKGIGLDPVRWTG